MKTLEPRLLLILGMFIFLVSFASACNLRATLVNQDPYPVTPGENVKLVFQVTGVQDEGCGRINFEFKEEFPFTVDPSMNPLRTIEGGIYSKDYADFWLLPYILRVDKDAKEGDNQIDVLISKSTSAGSILSSFNMNVKDVKTDFEVSVKNYDPSTNKITFEILNKGKNNIEALSVELKSQENVVLRGTSTNIIGSLDSNDFTTADFEASAEKGDIELVMHYTDITDNRRSVNETVSFDPAPFILKSKANQGSSTGKYVTILIVIVEIGYYIYRRKKKKEERHQALQRHSGK